MSDILSRIDTALAEHGTFEDPSVSPDAMRQTTDPAAAPKPESGLFDGVEVIHAYSRAQALVDGALVAVPEALAREAGFRHSVALTAAVWADCVTWTDTDTRCTGMPQDEDGRLWDVLWMARHAIRRAPASSDRVRVRLVRVPRDFQPDPDADEFELPEVELVAVVGPGDQGEPVITIQQPGED